MKQSILKFLNPILFIFFTITAVAMVLYKMTGGSETFGEIHEFAGIMFFLTGILHLYYNWGWVRANFLKKKKKHL